MTPLPKEPSGDHPLVQTVRLIIRCLRERQIIDDPSVLIERTANGMRIKARGGRTSGSPSNDKPVWL